MVNSSDNRSISISLIFSSIKLKGNLPEENIDFYITGDLYRQNNDINELINTTCFLLERKPSYNDSKTFFSYNATSENEWSLQFENISRNNNYIYDLQIKVDAVLKEYFQEEFIVYVTQVDLTGIKLEETNNNKNSWLPWGIPLIIIVAGLLVFFIIKIIKLKKKNDTLQLEMKSLAFSNDVQKNVLLKEQKISKNESDYESTFI